MKASNYAPCECGHSHWMHLPFGQGADRREPCVLCVCRNYREKVVLNPPRVVQG